MNSQKMQLSKEKAYITNMHIVRPQILYIDRKKSGLQSEQHPVPVLWRHNRIFFGSGGEGIIFGLYMGFYRTPYWYENDRVRV